MARAPQPKVRSDLFDTSFLRRVEHLALLARRISSSGQRANRRTKQIGAGIEFADHRSYSEGDDPRHLDWNVFARSQKLLLRRYEEEQDLSVYLMVDCSPSMNMGPSGQRTPFERALQVAAALGYVSLSNLDRVCLVPFTDGMARPTKTLRGRGQFASLLTQLSSLSLSGQTQLPMAVRDLPRYRPRRGLVVLISDMCDLRGVGDALRYLSFHGHDTLVLQLTDAQGFESNLWGDLTLVDVETGQSRDVTLTPALLQAYRNEYDELTDQVQAMCRQVGARHLLSELSTPFDQLVMRVFRVGGFLG
ncbi:MAG TPA: DUF58 domain-containing protein [Myxococcales bacterium]|nr:DUF58 domain-containing protein [Myxococcales bacterium]HAN30533.1 DUF58 domain-containing protein [Myxococcales bacterium]